jgi:hypothetical protein
MQNVSILQWACIAGVAALLIVPRLGSIRDVAAGLWAKASTAVKGSAVDEDAAMLAAFKTINVRLGPELAAQVWAKIQPIPTPAPVLEAKP